MVRTINFLDEREGVHACQQIMFGFKYAAHLFALQFS